MHGNEKHVTSFNIPALRFDTNAKGSRGMAKFLIGHTTTRIEDFRICHNPKRQMELHIF